MLSLRLKALANFINDANNVLDVGTDHGYLPIYLIENNKTKYCTASDIALLPCNNAISNVKKHNLENKIKVINTPGIEAIKNDKFDYITISGMGGKLISNIIEDNINLLNKEVLILQPNNNSYQLRKYLCTNGYFIDSEVIVNENDYFYEIIVFKKGKSNYSEKELYLGPILLKNNIEVLRTMHSSYFNYICDIIDKNILNKDNKLFKIKSILEEIYDETK